LEAQRGDTIAIVGPSGSGKSTLLHIIGALDRPDSGNVTVAGQDLARMDESAAATFRNRSIGFVFQAHHLLPQCTVLENVLVPVLATVSKVQPQAIERAKLLLRRTGLSDRLNHPATRLSGGERQRVTLVRALINQPVLLLADEPTGSLDQDSSRQIGGLLKELNAEHNTTLVVVTHSLELASGMERILRLSNGALEPAK
jgi:lipoprotein-releasing system ATP-binding protein